MLFIIEGVVEVLSDDEKEKKENSSSLDPNKNVRLHTEGLDDTNLDIFKL